ncbi:MAG: cell division protein FtsQ/DivIB [Henriciella sp.]|nr:cell division protein FtsQ/DivIB [Henriciella sp.]
MPKVKKPEPEEVYYDRGTQISSVIFGIVMVIAMIVAGAALLGGSLSKASQRWSNAFDGMSRSVGLSVESVELVGLEHIPAVARSVREAAMIEPGENMFRADPHTIRARVEDTRLVTNVRVYRLWPDTVMIRADAAQPTALWFDGEGWKVVDNFGRVMTRTRASDHAHLLKSAGPGAAAAAPDLVAALAKAPSVGQRVALARRVSERRWDLELTTGATLRLPGDEDLSVVAESLARMEASADLTRRAVRTIDMRVPGRVFLTLWPASSRVEEAA